MLVEGSVLVADSELEDVINERMMEVMERGMKAALRVRRMRK